MKVLDFIRPPAPVGGSRLVGLKNLLANSAHKVSGAKRIIDLSLIRIPRCVRSNPWVHCLYQIQTIQCDHHFTRGTQTDSGNPMA